jgi:dethiobiotin synthetase
MIFFITGIGTGVGKTFVSSILVEALEADYWKPIQAGNLNYTDTDTVMDLISNKHSIFYPETFRLSRPMSPHAAAGIDGVEIKLSDFIIPKTNNHLIIEGAGGLMVPLNNNGDLVIDLIKHLKIPVILVSKNYLGSINHTLLSVEALKSRNIPIAGIIFNGDDELKSESFILKYTGLKCLLKVKSENTISKEVVLKYKEGLRNFSENLF